MPASSSLLLLIALAAALAAALGFGLFGLCRRTRRRRERGQAQQRLQRLEEEAVLEERRRRQARMTHDLKAPIHALLGMTDLLAEGDLDPTQREQVGTLRTSAEFLLALVRDILDLERLEAGALRLRTENFSLRRLVAETLDLFRQEAAARGIALRTEFAADLPDALRGDPMRIRQVLMNLLSNAVKFTPARKAPLGAEIVVRIEPEDGHWHCAVIDPGVGMTAATVKRLFEPFAQADTTLVRNSQGSGLGLAICRHLVVAMGGEVCCESERGKGSTFHFTLPLVPARGRQTGPVETLGGSFGGRVLVVDDEAVNRRIALAHLEALGVTVVEAEGGAEALECLADSTANAFDLVLTDLSMPGVDGLTLCRRWRRRERDEGRERLPFVAVTARGEESREEELRAGLDDRLPKPFRRAELAALLDRWLSIDGQGEGDEGERKPTLQPWRETRAALVALGETTGEDEVAKIVAAFRESSADHLEAIEVAWHVADWAALRDPLHGLSGSAEFLGGRGVVATTAEIRRCAEQAKATDDDLLRRLRREIDAAARNFAGEGAPLHPSEDQESGSRQQ